MNKLEKIKKLESAKNTLKSEFFGLDEIIDSVIKSMWCWYVTPEVLERACVVSLFGMTGTGKSSLIKRLVELLDLTPKSIYIDCGKYIRPLDRSTGPVEEQILSCTGNTSSFHEEDIEINDNIFIFDEIQYARQIDKFDTETNNNAFRFLWNIIDCGETPVSDDLYECTYTRGYLYSIVDRMKRLLQLNQNLHVCKGEIVEKGYGKYLNNHEFSGDDNNSRILNYSDQETIEQISVSGSKITSLIYDINPHPLKEILDLLTIILDKINTQKKIICKRSIIFIIGNLDDVYTSSTNLNPDLDPDIFNKLTNEVTVGTIKKSLLKMFKPEQVSRIGNNIIKYPVLSKDSFKKIIEKEINNIVGRFNSTVDSSKKITWSTNFSNFIYSEGVYPVQGTRPLFSTIQNMFAPIFSNILINDYKSPILIDFKKDKITLVVDGKENYVDTTLNLKPLRDPKNKKKIVIYSVHEAGHAIVYSYLNGITPKYIKASSSNGGGFCLVYNENNKEIDSVYDLESTVKMSLAGYIAEKLTFPEELCLLGSESDITNAWESLSYGYYQCGYDGIPIKRENKYFVH